MVGNSGTWYPDRLVHELVLSRAYYTQLYKIFEWLELHVGPGLRYGNVTDQSYAVATWCGEEVFGHLFLRFEKTDDLIKFQLTWC